MKNRRSGYSLVEVLIAIAIVGVVLLTVVTLFYMGRRNVYSGKQMTYAVAVGTRILEDLSTMTNSDIDKYFSLTDATALGTVTVQGTDYTNSVLRDTTSCATNGAPPPAFTCTNDVNPYYLSAWRGLIDPAKLQDAKVGLILTPTSPTDATKKWSTAQFLKIRAFVQWNEAQRTRFAYFDTAIVNRQQ